MTYKWHFLNYCRFSPFLCLIVHPVCLCVFPLDIVAWWCLSVPKGRSGRSEDLAEEMDILPEGKNGLPSARVSAAVHYPGYVPLVWPPAGLEGLLVLRCLHTTVVRLNFKKRVFVRGRRVLLSLIVSGTPLGSFSVCVFFRDTSDLSAVCAYRVSDISKVFAEGKYKTPVTVETSFVKWVMYSGDVPVPRPGAVSVPSSQRVCASVRNKGRTQKATLF